MPDLSELFEKEKQKEEEKRIEAEKLEQKEKPIVLEQPPGACF